MDKVIFTSERQFNVWDYLVSHGHFLLRSQKGGERTRNIDIIFVGTYYIQVFSWFKGITIRQVDKTNLNGTDTVNKHLADESSKLYEIETSAGEKYYVVAGYVVVYENELNFGDTSLGVLQYEGRENEIARG